MTLTVALPETFVLAAEPVIEELSLSVMTDHEDLMGLGECLNLVERLLDLCCEHQVERTLEAKVVQVQEVLKGVVLREAHDPVAALTVVRGSVSQLQEACRQRRFTETDEAPAPEGDRDPGGAARGEQDQDEEAEAAVLQDRELIQDFIAEARDHLGAIEVELVNLEQNPGDPEIINSVFRPFHTIKGVSGFLNLTRINKVTHKVESLLEEVRSGELQVTQGMTDVILDVVDMLRVLLQELEDCLESGGIPDGDADVEALVQRLDAYAAHSQALPAPAADAQDKPLGEILTDRGVVTEADVSAALENQKESGKRIGEQLMGDGKADARAVTAALREQRGARASRVAANTIRVDTGKLDNLVDIVGELVIAQSLVAQDREVVALQSQRLQKNLAHVHRIMSELQRLSMSLRTVPIRDTFQKMIRLVRDLSKKFDKQVELQLEGEETEIDRNMVEELYEPLVHMIRNAVDHGLEEEQDRVKLGKAAGGTISLRAYHQGGSVVIEVADDGRGLDLERVRAKGVERGIVAAGEQLSDSGCAQLIFHPGFSTAGQVSDVSGRGVGMDVVKRTIDKLRGKIDIDTRRGKGTTFIIRLPLTLAIIDGMVVRVGEERYIIPTLAVQEALQPRKDEVSTVHNRGEVVRVRGSLLPLVRLHRLFQEGAGHQNPWESLVMVVSDNAHQKCLLIDELLGRQEVVIKSLGAGLKEVKGLSGATILGDGRVGLILDIAGIFGMVESDRNAGLLRKSVA
jgi:two-component system chemotaxis sensor kinase CheA